MKHKQLFKIMYVLFILILVCPNTSYAKTKSKPGTAIFVMANSAPFSFRTKHLSHKAKDMEIKIQVPQLTEPKDYSGKKEMNSLLLKDARKRMHQIIKEIKMLQKEEMNDKLFIGHFEYNESYSIVNSLEPYCTIQFLRYQYNGGAHGLAEVQYITWNKKEHRVIELNDLFKEKIDYQSLINAQIKEQITVRELKGEAFFKGSDGFQGIRSNQTFFINAQGDLVIVFNVYEIAPYTSGILYFSIPFNQIAPYLK